MLPPKIQRKTFSALRNLGNSLIIFQKFIFFPFLRRIPNLGFNITSKSVDIEQLIPTRSAARPTEVLEYSEDAGSGLSSAAYWHFEEKFQI